MIIFFLLEIYIPRILEYNLSGGLLVVNSWVFDCLTCLFYLWFYNIISAHWRHLSFYKKCLTLLLLKVSLIGCYFTGDLLLLALLQSLCLVLCRFNMNVSGCNFKKFILFWLGFLNSGKYLAIVFSNIASSLFHYLVKF